MSGGDDLAFAQARRKALQRAVLMRAAAGDEERLDPGLRGVQRVDTDPCRSADYGARQQRHAHVGGDAADHAVERAEFEPRRRRPAEFRKDLLEPLPVGAAGAEHQRGRTGLRRAGAQRGEAGPSPCGDQHQFFAEGDAS